MLATLTRRESIYLDIVRSLAAIDVVFGHAAELFTLPSTGLWGHQAIMVFFVLSGYVIAYVADTRETGLRVFLIARLARLWSVLVPALVLTVVCDIVGRTFGTDPRGFAGSPADLPMIRIGAMLAFVSESWVSIQPLSNGAAWSLCLEFWYYVMFGLWVFLRPGWIRAAVVLGAGLLAGHKGLLLFPVWLMGVALQRVPVIRRHPAWVDLALWAGGLLVMAWIVLTRAYDPAIAAMQNAVTPWFFTQLAQARVFWLDWLFGFAVAAHLLGARQVASWLPLERIAVSSKWCAGVSFAAYLFHFPLLHLWAAFLPPDKGWLAIALTLAVIGVLGPPAERSKGAWRRLLTAAWAWTERHILSRWASLRRDPA